MPSKYQLQCSCIRCKRELTVQSLNAHVKKCTSVPLNTCGCCGAPTNNVRFCSHSCRARTVNATRSRKVKSLTLNKEEKVFLRFLNGQIAYRPTLRRLITKLHGYKCNKCSVSEWNSEPIVLVVDHIDGDAGNNFPENVQLLCPNCNSQTLTFGGRNKGKGRKSRGLPLN